MKHKFHLISLFLLVPVQMGALDIVTQNLSSNLAIAQQVVNTNTFEYIPPAERDSRKQQNRSMTIRCTSEPEGAINLLVPQDHTPATISGRPTFFWYIDTKTPALVDLTLVEPKRAEPVFKTRMKVDESGLFHYTVPPNIPELEVGKEYRWTVQLVLDLESFSRNPYASAWVKRIPYPNELKQKLTGVVGSYDRSRLYASSGVWYDSLSTLYRNLDRPTISQKISQSPKKAIEQINSGKSIWFVNQLPTGEHSSASQEDLLIAKGASCG